VVVATGFPVWSVVGMVSAGADVDQARQDLAAAQEHLEDLQEDDATAIRTARDEALTAGREAVTTMNTLDYRTVEANLDEWERVSTGALHAELVSGREQSRSAVTAAKSVTKASVLSSGVTEVDEQAGTASVLVALRVNVVVGGAEPTDKYVRMRGTLSRTGGEWKLDSLEQVAYGS
jgi:Mce-associated membrane protein